MSVWLVKDHFKGKIYLKTSNQSKAVSFANYYNNNKKVPFTQIKISYSTSLFKSMHDLDINKQFGKRKLFELEPSSFESPFVKDQKHYSYRHIIYLKKKFELVKILCYKYHLWPFNARDGHKLCGFDW